MKGHEMPHWRHGASQVIEILLRTRTPLHVGTGSGTALTDAAVRRRADGRLVIPGSALAGVLRGAAERRADVIRKRPADDPLAQCHVATDDRTPCRCRVCRLFGSVTPGERDASRDGEPEADVSSLWIDDAVVDGDAPPPILPIRDAVAMDRRDGAAQDRRKYDYEAVPPGTAFRWKVRLEPRGDAEAVDRELLGTLLLRAKDEGLTAGGRSARGFGRLEIEALTLRRFDLNHLPDLHAVLRGESEAPPLRDDDAWAEVEEWATGFEPVSTAVDVRFDVVLTWPGTGQCAEQGVPASTLLISDPEAAFEEGFDRAPRGRAVNPEIPTTSIRGVLRTRAERILRTIGGAEAACDPTHPIKSCWGRSRQGAEPSVPGPEQLCTACRLFGCEALASTTRMWVDELEGEFGNQPFDHVAIDRFTGGSRDKLKFDEVALIARGQKVRLPLHLHIRDAEPWMVGLLALVLKDLARSELRVGAGAAKGHGRVTGSIEQVVLQGDSEAAVKQLVSSICDAPLFDEFASEARWSISREDPLFGRLLDGAVNALRQMVQSEEVGR